MFFAVGGQLFNSLDIGVFTPDGYIYFVGRPACFHIQPSLRDAVAKHLLEASSSDFLLLKSRQIIGLHAVEMITPAEVQLKGQGLMRAVRLSPGDFQAVVSKLPAGEFENLGTALVRLAEISTVSLDGYVRFGGEGVFQRVSAETASGLIEKLTAKPSPAPTSPAGPAAASHPPSTLPSALKDVPKEARPSE